MSPSIFHINADNSLSELVRSEFDSEDLFQRLLAEYPQILSAALGRDGGLLLVQREQPVPDALDGASRWSLDHLFLDREGVPVLVEVKRATDTRARREVVAQMLDYAANGVAYWPIDTIIAAFRNSNGSRGRSADTTLEEFLGGDPAESFWKAVESNLRSGRIRMVFIADAIGRELRRIIEFLNEQMRPAEVLAIEVVQFTHSNGSRTLVPSLVGATERAQAAKATLPPLEMLSLEEWLESLRSMKSERAARVAHRIFQFLGDGPGKLTVSDSLDSVFLQLRLPTGKVIYPFFVRRSTGAFEVQLGNLRHVPKYASDEARLGLQSELLRELPGLRSTGKATSWPSIQLTSLEDETSWLKWTSLVEAILLQLSEVDGRLA